MYGGALHGMDRLFRWRGASYSHGRWRAGPFAGLDNAALAGNLRGHLLLVYGELDENAPPALTLQLAAALNKAQRSYDLLYLAGQDHELFPQRRHLHAPHVGLLRAPPGGQQPPGYGAGPAPGWPGLNRRTRDVDSYALVRRVLKAVHVARSIRRQAMSYIDGFVLAVPPPTRRSSSPMHAQGIPFSSSTARCAWSSAGR